MFRVGLFLLAFVLVPGICAAIIDDEYLIGKRGDANNDQAINNTDIIFLSNYLYDGGPEPPCMNQADVNDDGSINVSDPIYLGNWLFVGGPPPPAPGPENPDCDPDPTSPGLGCYAYDCP